MKPFLMALSFLVLDAGNLASVFTTMTASKLRHSITNNQGSIFNPKVILEVT